MNVAILVSGSGTNLQALLDAEVAGDLAPANIAVIISNNPNAHGLDRAKTHHKPTAVVNHRDFAQREDFEQSLLDVLSRHNVQVVVLAGFMRILTNHFVSAFPLRIINTHPALCPAFPGIHAPQQALDYGVRITGCTVHFVDEKVDTGPIIFQEAVGVLPTDTVTSLHDRIRACEHRLLPRALQALAAGRITVRDRRVSIRS